MQKNLKAKKSLGQNFLKDQFYVSKIINSFNLKDDDVVIEIGPGMGDLTKNIINYVKKLYAVEIDQRMYNYLSENIKADNFIIFNEDFLKFKIEEKIPEKKIKFVGNLPYYITSSIIFRILEIAATGNFELDSFTIMIQKEVAERLVGKPGNKVYGVVTVLTDLFCEKEILFDVPPEAFSPKPKVMSSIIKFKFKNLSLEQLGLLDYTTFRKTVKTLFKSRRKMIRNTIPGLLNNANLTQIESVELTKRPEALNLNDYIKLANEIFNLNKSNV